MVCRFFGFKSICQTLECDPFRDDIPPLPTEFRAALYPSSGSSLPTECYYVVSEEKKPSSLELFTDLPAGVKLPDELERAILDVMMVAPFLNTTALSQLRQSRSTFLFLSLPLLCRLSLLHTTPFPLPHLPPCRLRFKTNPPR